MIKSGGAKKRLKSPNDKRLSPPTPRSLSTNFQALVKEEMNETFLQILSQVLFPYLVAGVGMVFAGSVLNIVKQWDVFLHVTEVIILIPALLGLKGNLEMTLAARLSTQANLGTTDKPAECWKLVVGNMTLTMFQALVVGFLAAVLAICLGWLQRGQMELSHALLLCSSSMITSFMASIILGSLMCFVVLTSKRFHINPDNVATPVAGSLGDLVAITFLALSAAFFYQEIEARPWVSPVVMVVLCSSLPFWWHYSSSNDYTSDVLWTGWAPIIGAMTISSLGGLVLDNSITHYENLASFQPVINGIGGNLVAIQASRLSTSLHRVGPIGTDVFSISQKSNHSIGSKSSGVLLALVVPGHLLFLTVIWFIHQTDADLLHHTRNFLFAFLYLAAAFVQVALLLWIARSLVIWQWSRSMDPDTCSIPYLTAIGDLLGIILLASAFYLHEKFEMYFRFV